MAWEPEMIWLITSVVGGRAERTAAQFIDRDRGQFREIDLVISD